MAIYKTPGVYVEEKSLLPPSVATVSTAIPAFIGYTEKAVMDDENLSFKPVRIDTFLEYINLFGEARPSNFTVRIEGDSVKPFDAPAVDYYMYYSLSMYFKNGGGSCYIVSVGDYSKSAPLKADMQKGLNALKKMDEPTLLMLTDAVNLQAADFHELCQSSLMQCSKLKDRFAIFDVPPRKENDVAVFREGIGINDLKYGAAYYPYLKTSQNYQYGDDNVTLEGFSDTVGEASVNGIRVTFDGVPDPSPSFQIKEAKVSGIGFNVKNNMLTITVPDKGSSAAGIVSAWDAWDGAKESFFVDKNGTFAGKIKTKETVALMYDAKGKKYKLSDSAIKNDQTALYSKIKNEIAKKRVVMPPASSIAGIYAKVDGQRGVWKAPANCSIAGVIEPVELLNNNDQENLNIDPTAGKSINAIRSFTGKGTLVWGARTLAGNDNEWRYISVRRLFNFVEESVQKSTAFAVFEANTPMTWLKVRTMITSFLDSLWKDGALAGGSQDQAFFVKVGLGETMTEQDVLEGRMNVEIGLVPVRPAEFIILTFSHKLQNA